MASCRSVAAAVDNTTTALASYSLKYNSGTCCTMEAYSPPVIRQDKGEAKGRTSVWVTERTLANSLPCKVAKLVKRKRRTWRTLSWISTPYDMQSFTVWNGLDGAGGDSGETDEVLSELRVIVVDLAFFITKPKETRRRRTAVC